MNLPGFGSGLRTGYSTVKLCALRSRPRGDVLKRLFVATTGRISVRDLPIVLIPGTIPPVPCKQRSATQDAACRIARLEKRIIGGGFSPKNGCP